MSDIIPIAALASTLGSAICLAVPAVNGTYARMSKYHDSDYVASQMERRRGDCLPGCGRCCGPRMRCWFLLPGSGCGIYPIRPSNCRSFPLDDEDIDAAQCPGYWFVDEDGGGDDGPRWAAPDELRAVTRAGN